MLYMQDMVTLYCTFRDMLYAAERLKSFTRLFMNVSVKHVAYKAVKYSNNSNVLTCTVSLKISEY